MNKPPEMQSATMYERLRFAIVSGELRPNEPLIEDDLATKYGTSRTPVREGLQRLSADGLLVRRKRGWAVREFTTTEIRENYEVRAALEGLAARFAAERGSDEERRGIMVQHEYRCALGTPDSQQRLSTNREFHEAIFTAAHNDRLRHLIHLAGNFYLTRRVAVLTNDAQYNRAQQEHGVIAQAILDRDADAADRAMRLHIMNAFHTWQEFQGL